MKHDTLELVLQSIATEDEFGTLRGLIHVPMLRADSELIIDRGNPEPDEYDEHSILDCLQLTKGTANAAGQAMLAMHLYFADECGDLDVSLKTADEIWKHTYPWYVIVQREDCPRHRYLRFHFKADWETYHGVEVVIRDGQDVVFAGHCGIAGPISAIEAGRCGDENYASRG